MLRDSSAPFYELRIVFGRTIPGNDMDFTRATCRFVHEIDMLQQLYIDGGDFSCVMATQNVIHLIQRCQVILPCLITVADFQAFVRMYVEKGELGVREFVRVRFRNRGTQQLATEQHKPDSRRLQEGPSSPGIWIVQESAPEEGALQSVKTPRVLMFLLVSKATGSVNSLP